MFGVRIGYFILLGIFTVFIFFYGGIIPYSIFFALIILPFVSLIYTIFVYNRFKFVQSVDKKFIVKGDVIKYTFHIGNEDLILYPYVTIKFFNSKTIFSDQFSDKSISLFPSSENTLEILLDCRYCGNYEIGVEKIRIEDFFGLFSLTYDILSPLEVNVNPRVIHLDYFKLNINYTCESISKSHSIGEDSGLFHDVRKYSYGDSMKKIHWNISAKINETMVRQFRNTTDTNLLIIPDFTENTFTEKSKTIVWDKLIETSVALGHYCLLNYIPVDILCYEDNIRKVYARDISSFAQIYECVSNSSVDRGNYYPDIFKTYCSELDSDTNIIIITSKLNYDLYTEIYKTILSGHYLILIFIDPGEMQEQNADTSKKILEDIPKIGAISYHVGFENDIKSVLEVLS